MKRNKNLIILIYSFLSIFFFGLISELLLKFWGVNILVGAFGASTAILFNSPNEKISSYKNMVFGYLISCAIGISLNYLIIPGYSSLKIALAVSLSIYLMRVLKTFHPAGGAIALLSSVYEFELPSELIKYFVGTSILGTSIFYLVVLIVRRANFLDIK